MDRIDRKFIASLLRDAEEDLKRYSATHPYNSVTSDLEIRIKKYKKMLETNKFITNEEVNNESNK